MKVTPWQYLENWGMSDRGPDDTLARLNASMQERWPGRYTIVEREVHDPRYMYRVLKWEFKFDSPRDETWFRMQHPC